MSLKNRPKKSKFTNGVVLSFAMTQLLMGQVAYGVDYDEECSGINKNTHADEWSFCVKAVTASNYDIDCVECLYSQQQEESNPWLEALGIVAGPLAYFGSAYVGAKYAYKSQKAWSSAYESGYDSCRSQFNSALDYNVSSGATGYTADELSTLMSSCNGNGLGLYSGYRGLMGNGYGGYGNPYLSAGYSSGFMSGMMGPYYGGSGLSGGLSLGLGSGLGYGYGIGSGSGLGLGLSGGLSLGLGTGLGSGLGSLYGSGLYGNGLGLSGGLSLGLGGGLGTGLGTGYGLGTGLGGSYGLGLGLGLGLGGGLGSSYGYGYGMGNGLGSGLGLSGGLSLGLGTGLGTGYGNGYGLGLGLGTSGYGYNPYAGLGGSVNLGLGTNGGWGYSTGYPSVTGAYGLPSYALGGSGMVGANLGLGTGSSPYSIYGTGANGWYPSGSYFGNTGGYANNNYWNGVQNQQTSYYAQAANQSNLANQLNASSYQTANAASSALYNNYASSASAYGSYGSAGYSGYYGATPYAVGNLGANLGIGGYAYFGF